jgi:hypothetical protein
MKRTLSVLFSFEALCLAVIVAVCLLLAAPMLSCAGAPRSVEQLNSMDEAEYHAWLDRVGVWSEAIGATVAISAPKDVANIDTLAQTLVAATGGPMDPKLIGHAARAIPWASPLIAPLMLELQAMLDERGGLPGGERGAEIVSTVAASLSKGLHANDLEPKPSK